MEVFSAVVRLSFSFFCVFANFYSAKKNALQAYHICSAFSAIESTRTIHFIHVPNTSSSSGCFSDLVALVLADSISALISLFTEFIIALLFVVRDIFLHNCICFHLEHSFETEPNSDCV